jgi:glycosyltransferase involved in cell wall biosynthesis
VKIAFVLAGYSVTGVPLAQIRLARALAKRGHDIELIFGSVDGKYTLPEPPGIRVTVLGRDKARKMLGPLVSYLRAATPDVVFSAEDHMNAIVLLAAVLARSRAKISCSSRVTPYDTYSTTPLTKGWFRKHLMKLLTRRADVLTCVGEDMIHQYHAVFGSTRHICIHNIIDDAASRKRMLESVDEQWLAPKTRPVLISAGTLTVRKSFSDLILAVKKVRETRDVALIILGEGPLRTELSELIARNGLGDSVKLLGQVDNPLKYFRLSDIFVLSSLVEGLPNVLVEAMMSGCTPVSTDCPTGPREVLQSGKYGYLVPVRDPDAMATAIVRALDHPIPGDELQSAIRDFGEQAVIDRHFEALGIQKPCAA